MKVRKCSYKNCDKPRMKRPGNNTLYFKCCVKHQIKAVLDKQRNESIKYKADLQKIRESKKKTIKTEKSRARDRADGWFSKYIRLKYSYEVNGFLKCKCYTCGKEHDILEIENGHFQSRRHILTRYHINNARPQDTYCNKHLHGNADMMEANLKKEIGEDEVELIKILAHTEGEDTEEYHRSMSTKFRKLFKKLLIEKGFSNPWK